MKAGNIATNRVAVNNIRRLRQINEVHERKSRALIFQRLSGIEIDSCAAASTKRLTINELKPNESMSFLFSQVFILFILKLIASAQFILDNYNFFL